MVCISRLANLERIFWTILRTTSSKWKATNHRSLVHKTLQS
jgi:hypothetical protein